MAYHNNPKDTLKAKLGGVVTGTFLIILNLLMVIMVFGANLCAELRFPLYSLAQMIEVGDFFERLELLVMIFWIAAGFLSITMLYYISTLGFAQLLKLPDYNLLPLLKYTIEVDINCNLGEQMCIEDLNPEMIAVLEDEERQAVKKEIVALIRKAQEEYKLDILGLGEATMREFPKEWNKVKEQWAEEFPQAEVEVKVNSRLSLTGMLKSLKTQK